MANPSKDMIETRYPNVVYLAATVFDLSIASAMTGGKDPFSMTMRVGGSNPIAVHTRFNRPGFFGVAGIASGAEASSSFLSCSSPSWAADPEGSGSEGDTISAELDLSTWDIFDSSPVKEEWSFKSHRKGERRK
jgi:hypothetical protein